VQVSGLLDRCLSVVGEERRDLERHPAVHPVGLLVDLTEHPGGACDVGQRQLEEELLTIQSLLAQLGDLLVVGVA
jgi:hypothetical protein